MLRRPHERTLSSDKHKTNGLQYQKAEKGENVINNCEEQRSC